MLKMQILAILIIISLVTGFYYYRQTRKEYFQNNTTNNVSCANVLIQNGSRIYLYNTRVKRVAGVNPIVFENLEDYADFLAWQRSNNIRCPILFLQKSYDAQGNSNYTVRPSPLNLQGGTPNSNVSSSVTKLLTDADRNDFPFNQNNYPAFDAHTQDIGVHTPLDNIKQQDDNMLYSPNPMDDNWGGETYTQSLVDSGYYKDNNVQIMVQ